MNNYLRLRKIPLIRILIPFIFGIFLCYTYFDHINLIYVLTLTGIVILTVSIVVLFFSVRNKFLDYLFITIIFLSGIIYTHFSLKTQAISKQEKVYRGILCETPQLKKNSACLKLKLPKNPAVSGVSLFVPKMILYTNRDSVLVNSLRVGDECFFYARLDSVKNLGNPGEFDYRRYLITKHILFQSYVPLSRITIYKNRIRFLPGPFIANIRAKIINQLQKYDFSENSFAIILALTAGNREFVPEELEKSYINAGVVHVLSVSGLHVGIIFMFLQVLLKFLDYRRRNRIIKIVIIFAVIWLYAVISGLSPSVVRAALMFSLIIFGQSIQRDVSAFNILAIAALIMLIVNPLQLFDVGFQLSFMAVSGILYFQPIFDTWFTAKNGIVDYLYKLFTVSLSAQLSTLPLTLFYFHQFPMYFWLANLIVIPVSFVILILALVFIFTAGIPFVSGIIGWLLQNTTAFMNGWIDAVEKIPGAVIQDIRFTVVHVFLIFGLIIFVFSWLKRPYIVKLYASIAFLLILFIYGIFRKASKPENNILYVYNTPKYTSVAVLTDSVNYLIGNYNPANIPENILKLHHRVLQLNNRYSKTVIYDFDSISTYDSRVFHRKKLNVSLITLANKQKIIFYPGNKPAMLIAKLSADFFLVSKNKFPPSVAIQANTIILDSSNKPYIEPYWERYCKKWTKKLVIVRKQGAFKVNLVKT